MTVAAVNLSTAYVNASDEQVNSTEVASAVAAGIVTRVGLLTIPQIPYGSFAGKAEQEDAPPTWGYIVDAAAMDYVANAEPQHYIVKVRA